MYNNINTQSYSVPWEGEPVKQCLSSWYPEKTKQKQTNKQTKNKNKNSNSSNNNNTHKQKKT